MGLFDFLRKRPSAPSPPPLDDPDFGPLSQDDEHDDGIDWIGERGTFLGETNSVSVLGDASGPSAATRATFHELVARYATMKPAIAAVLSADVDPEVVAKHGGVDGFLELSKVTHLRVHGADGVEISYMVPWDPEHHFCVIIDDWQPTHYEI